MYRPLGDQYEISVSCPYISTKDDFRQDRLIVYHLGVFLERQIKSPISLEAEKICLPPCVT